MPSNLFSRLFIVILLMSAGISSSFAQSASKFTISGYIKDTTNGEGLLGATIAVVELSKGTNTNDYGFFSLDLPPGHYTLKVSYVGFQTKTIPVDLTGSIKLNFELNSSSIATKEVVVTAEKKDANVTSTSVGRQELSIETINSIPAFMGEVDVLKTLQLLPGVMAAGEGNTGFYVRGGGPDQNLVLLDEATVYNTGHLFGFFSVFNSDAVKSVSIEKGAMPAQYGGRLSSVVDVKMSEGNMKHWEIAGGIGLIASRLTIQGPIKKDKCSIIVSGRRTYIDLLSLPFTQTYQKGRYKGDGYYFYDLNTKINYIVSDKDRIYLSGYFGRDVFNFKAPEGDFSIHFPWGNSTVTGRWNHIFGDKLFMNTMFIYNDYRFDISSAFRGLLFDVSSDTRDIGAKVGFDYSPLVGHMMKFGADYTNHMLTPYQTTGILDSVNIHNTNTSSKFGHELAVYFSDDFEVNKWLKINLGIRASLFCLAGPYKKGLFDSAGHKIDSLDYAVDQPVKTYYGLEPRASARFKIAKSTSIKVGVALTKQYIHLVSNSTTTLPFDLWVPSTPNVKPQMALQYSIGGFQNFHDDMFEASVEVYYKQLYNQIEYGENKVVGIDQDIEDFFVYGKGRSYGAEFFVKKARGKFQGWVGYTLAWTERKFESINNNTWFPAKYDRRHDLNIVLMYEINPRWKVAATFVYASGNTSTLPVQLYYNNGTINQIYGPRNFYRLPAYHRLDLSATYTLKHKRFPKLHSDINFSIYNVYSRQNPYFIYVDVSGNPNTGSLKTSLKQVSLFPILPSITWNFKFG
jgi:hypothetical protein